MRRFLAAFSVLLSLPPTAVLVSVLADLPPSPFVLAAQAAIPLTLSLSALSASAAALSRSPTAKRASFLVLGLWASLLVDINLRSSPPPPGKLYAEAVSANMLLSNKTTPEAVADVLRLDPDVLVTVETSPEAKAALIRSGLVLVASGSGRADHVMVWSTLPARALAPVQLNDRSLPLVAVTLYDREVLVLGVHLMSPTTDATLDLWNSNWDYLTPALKALPSPALVMGDFNSSVAHSRLAALLGQYDSASAGSWSTYVSPTWPASPYRWWSKPLQVLDLDHILLSGLSSSSFARTPIAGSDHLAVSAHVGLLDRADLSRE